MLKEFIAKTPNPSNLDFVLFEPPYNFPAIVNRKELKAALTDGTCLIKVSKK
jgi:hypothetical protein